MPTVAQQGAYEKQLIATLSRAIDFLKFGEAKNAALLTFSSAWLASGLSQLTSVKPLPQSLHIAFVIAVTGFAVAALTAILSFIPNLDWRVFHRRPPVDGNYLFFGDLETVPLSYLREKLDGLYLPDEGQAYTDKYLDDLISQIGINSRIAAAKHRKFNIGASVAMASMLFVGVPFLYWIWKDLILWLAH